MEGGLEEDEMRLENTIWVDKGRDSSPHQAWAQTHWSQLSREEWAGRWAQRGDGHSVCSNSTS